MYERLIKQIKAKQEAEAQEILVKCNKLVAQIEREKTYIQLFKEQTEKAKLAQAKNDLENL